MSVIIGMLSLVWGSYIVQPEWFDDGPYVELRQGLSEGECKIDTSGTDNICVETGHDSAGEDIYSTYGVDKNAKPATEGTLTYLDCDAWQGCYFKQ